MVFSKEVKSVRTQTWIGIMSVASLVAIAGIFLKVAMSTQPREENYENITKPGYAIRRKYFWALLIVSIVFLVISVISFPYPAIMEAKITGEPVVVKATGFQFGWELDKDVLPVGKPVRFDVTAKDVNHGFGIYYHGKDGSLKKGIFVAQTQAMPDYINKLYVTFKDPGVYRIWCLEYCGAAHHIMTYEFRVE